MKINSKNFLFLNNNQFFYLNKFIILLIIYNKMFYIVNNFYEKLKILLYRDLTVFN